MKVQDLQIEKFSQPADSKGVRTLEDSANSSPPVCFVASSWSFKASSITCSLMANIQKRIPGMAGCTQWGQHDNDLWLNEIKKKQNKKSSAPEDLPRNSEGMGHVLLSVKDHVQIMLKSYSWAELAGCRSLSSLVLLGIVHPHSWGSRKKSGIKVLGETCKCLKREWPWFWRCSHP